jgi:hypothetical protein
MYLNKQLLPSLSSLPQGIHFPTGVTSVDRLVFSSYFLTILPGFILVMLILLAT